MSKCPYDAHSGVTCSPSEPLIIVSGSLGSEVHAWRILPDGSWNYLWTREEWSYPFFTADGKHLYSSVRPHNSSAIEPATLCLYDLETGDLLPNTLPSDISHGAISSDMNYAVGYREKQFVILDLFEKDGEPQVIEKVGTRRNWAYAFHPHSHFLAAASNDGTVRYFNPQTGRLMRSYDWNLGGLRSITFSRDGLLAAAGSDKGKIVVWDVDV